jgi:hypothetical protein
MSRADQQGSMVVSGCDVPKKQDVQTTPRQGGGHRAVRFVVLRLLPETRAPHPLPR